MKRRTFLTISAGAAVAAPFIFTKKSSVWAAASSPLVVSYHPNACTWGGTAAGTGVHPFSVDQAIVNQLVDATVMRLTGKTTVGEAWLSLFTAKGISVSAATKVGIKINNATDMGSSKFTSSMNPYGAKVATVNAIVAGLVQMLSGTFPIENITVFDKFMYTWSNVPSDPAYPNYPPANNADNVKLVLQGFPSSTVMPYKVSGTGKATIMLADPAALGTTPVTFNAGNGAKTVPQKIFPVVIQQNAMINVSVPKVNVGAGVTASLKNTYGCVDQCVTTHGSTTAEIAAAPTITLCVPSVYKNVDAHTPCVLNVLDAIAGDYDGQAFAGPAFFKKAIAMSTDPVTLDYYAVQIVNEARRANRLSNIDTPPTTANYTTVVTGSQFPGTVNADGFINAHYLAWAASSTFGLGNMNNDNMVFTDLTSVSGPGVLAPLDRVQGRPMDLSRSPAGWALNVVFDNSGRTHRAESRILDLFGREVRSFKTLTTRQPRATLAWDGRNYSGITAPAGVYTWETRIDGHVYTQAIQHTR
jgi:hypothetical protein